MSRRSLIPLGLILSFFVLTSCMAQNVWIKLFKMVNPAMQFVTETPLPPATALTWGATTSTPLPPKVKGGKSTSTPLPIIQHNGTIEVLPTLSGTAIPQLAFDQGDCACAGFNVAMASADKGYLNCSYGWTGKNSSYNRVEFNITQQSTEENTISAFTTMVNNIRAEAGNLYSGDTLTDSVDTPTKFDYIITSTSDNADLFCGRTEDIEIVQAGSSKFIGDINIDACELSQNIVKTLVAVEDCMYQAGTNAANR